jgi:hypothetical protein
MLLLAVLAAPAMAQVGPVYHTGEPTRGRVLVSGEYARYDDEGRSLHSFSSPITVFVPLGSNAALALAGAVSSSGGTDLATLSGPSDARVVLSYFQPVGSASVVASMSASALSGRRELSYAQFATAVHLGQSHYDFGYSSQGQGFNLMPALTLAVPVSESFVVGAGLSYLHRGGYRPLAQVDQLFEPGGEVVLTGGGDLVIGHAATVSVDLSHAFYGTDRWGDLELRPGGRTIASVQAVAPLGSHELSLLGRYRMRARSEALVEGADPLAFPDQVQAAALFRLRAGNDATVGFIAGTRFFQATTQIDSRTLFDIGLAPEVRLMGSLRGLARFTYTAGSLSGFEAMFGMGVDL